MIYQSSMFTFFGITVVNTSVAGGHFLRRAISRLRWLGLAILILSSGSRYSWSILRTSCSNALSIRYIKCVCSFLSDFKSMNVSMSMLRSLSSFVVS